MPFLVKASSALHGLFFKLAPKTRHPASLGRSADNSTAQLMDDFYAGIAAGHSYAASLRAAKRKMLHSAHARPYYWAPFQIYSRTIGSSRN